MKNKNLLITAVLLYTASLQVSAQVSGISYTISPAAQYTWWNSQAGLKDGFLLGGKFGLGFGENLELRGSYMRSVNLETQFDDFGLPNYADSLFTPRGVTLSRLGGELKANLGRGTLLPFVTLGSGIQSIEMDTFGTNKNIYASIGFGVKFSIGDRSTFTLEGRNTQYNFNAGRRLLTEQDKQLFGVTDNDFETKRLGNWSLGASLQFYLGGRRPGSMSELDKAYYNTFASGVKGLRVPIEPTLGRMNFNNKLPYRDAWMGGGYAGLDFGPYVGLRGFYFQAMENNSVNLKFDKLAMYGGEVRMRTNLSKGLTPVLIIGGGYLKVGDAYVPQDSVAAGSQAFALGGLSLNLPISSTFNLFGGARAILTSNSDVDDLQGTDQIQTSWMYSVGFKLSFGQKTEAPEAVFKTDMNAALADQQTRNEAEKEKNRLESEQLKTDYQTKVVDLEKQLNEAYAQQDVEKAATLLREKDKAQQVVNELESREAEGVTAAKVGGTKPGRQPQPATNSRISLTPSEFENLIEEILENMDGGRQGLAPGSYPPQSVERRLAEMEQMLLRMEQRQLGIEPDSVSLTFEGRNNIEFSARLLAEIQKLNEKVDRNTAAINAGKDGAKQVGSTPTPAASDEGGIPPAVQHPSVTEGNVLGVKSGGKYLHSDSTKSSLLTYEGMSGFAGINTGGQTTANVGFRWHYGIGRSRFEFMPETFFGFASPASFGITGNLVYPVVIRKFTPVTPYFGAGAGFMQIAENGDDKLRLNYNFIFGTYVNVFKGRLYVDLTARNLFKYNQIIAGYRFSF